MHLEIPVILLRCKHLYLREDCGSVMKFEAFGSKQYYPDNYPRGTEEHHENIIKGRIESKASGLQRHL